MDYGFSLQQWSKTRENYENWWQNKLGRPLVRIGYFDSTGLEDHKGANNRVTQSSYYDTDISTEYILDYCEYRLLGSQYFGDHYPAVLLDSGPGAVAAYLGCRPEKDTNGGIWFDPPEGGVGDITGYNLSLDNNNPHYKRMRDITEAAVERFSQNAVITLPDLGGNMDILSSFFGTEGLSYALYDNPEDIQRLLWQSHDAWHKCFDRFCKIIGKHGDGYTDWSHIYSTKPAYILQSDYAYMIGPEMFDEFVLPELTQSANRVGRSFYHLDGTGQLAHLDKMLKIESLDGVQWVPGAGNPLPSEWPEVLKKIADAGKLQFIGCDLDGLERVRKAIGSLESVCVSLYDRVTKDNMDDVLRRLDKMGISF